MRRTNDRGRTVGRDHDASSVYIPRQAGVKADAVTRIDVAAGVEPHDESVLKSCLWIESLTGHIGMPVAVQGNGVAFAAAVIRIGGNVFGLELGRCK